MLNGIIYSPNSCLSDSFLFNFQFSQLLPPAPASDLRPILLEAARLNLTNLIIDLDAADNYTINEAIHSYRIQRPTTRIIAIAHGRQPGDPVVAELVSRGIYDIAVPEQREETEELLKKILNSEPATYAMAARWAVSSLVSLSFRKSDTKSDWESRHKYFYTPSEIIIERPIGLTTVAVAGVGSGAGASYISLSLAHNLAFNGYKVLLAEMPQGITIPSQYSPYILHMGKKLKDEDIFDIKGIHIYPNSRSMRSIEYIFKKAAWGKYEYLVLDLGNLTSLNIGEMERAALPVLITHTSPTRYDVFNKVISQEYLGVGGINFERWQLLLNITNKVHSKWFRSGLEIQFANVIDVPFIDNPFNEEDTIMPLILSPIMRSTKTIKKRRGLSFLRR